MGNAHLVADAPCHDRAWLGMLLATLGEDAPTPVPRIWDFDELLGRSTDFEGVRRAYAHLDRHPAPHRAGPDAARLLGAWLAARGPGP